MNLKLILILSLLCCSIYSTQAQKIPKNRIVIVKTNDELSKAEVAINPKKARLIKDRFYYSYYNDQIYKSRYGSSYFGHLLNGRFEKFYRNTKAIKEKGRFQNGLKQGIWKTWYPDGQLYQIQNWRKGNQHGKFKEFDQKGALTKAGNYRKGLLHGNITTYKDGLVLNSTKYRKGKIKIAKVKPEKKKKKKKRKKEKKKKGKEKEKKENQNTAPQN